MNYAPSVRLTATPATISNGRAGIFETVAVMRELVKRGKCSPVIRQAAASCVFLTPEKNEYSECEAVFNYVRDHVRYLRDISNVETLATPEKTLLSKIGDCDDQSMLCAALMESIGYPTRFVVTAYNDPAHLEHVYLQVQCCGYWIDCDPTEQHGMGYAPPGAVAVYIENL
jgi:transglutaminase-like putative cysteine protease